MFQSKKPKLLRVVCHARKFRLLTDAPRDTQCSRALRGCEPIFFKHIECCNFQTIAEII